MNKNREICMESVHGRRAKCKREFKAVIDKVLITTFVFATVLGSAVPAYAASTDTRPYNPGTSYTQEYGISVENAIKNLKATIEFVKNLQSSGMIDANALNTFANQLFALETAVRSSSEGVTIEVKQIIAEAEQVITNMNKKDNGSYMSDFLNVALISVKSNLGIDNVTTMQAKAELKSFSDVAPNRWSYQNIMLCVQHGAIQGTKTPDANGVGEFNPAGTVTLGQFLTVLTRLVSKDYLKDTTVPQGKNWAYPYYMAAINSGLINRGDFAESALGSNISREDMSYLLVRAAGLNGETLETNPYAQANIPDFNSVHSARRSYVLQAYSNGLITGYDGGYFGPKDTMTREQMATVVCRLMEYAPRAEVNFGKEETKPETKPEHNTNYFCANSYMVTPDYQKQMASTIFNSITCYKNSNGEFSVKVDPITLPKELVDAGWEISIGVQAYDNSEYEKSLRVSSGGIYLKSGESYDKVMYTGSKVQGYRNISAKDIGYVLISVSLYHKDYSKNDLKMTFKSVSYDTTGYVMSYPNCNAYEEHGTVVNMNMSAIYSGLGLK